MDVHNLSADDVQFLLERKFDYDHDARELPDAARAARFNVGWHDAVASLAGERELYTDLHTLTWQNLGYRLGRVFGDVPDEIKETVLTLFSEQYDHRFLWYDEVKRWLARRNAPENAEQATIDYFERIFTHTRCIDKAWFGVHKDVISLVVGGIWLASLTVFNQKYEIWLLLDEDPPRLPDFEYTPVKSTQRYAPLTWLYSRHTSDIQELLQSDAIWASYAVASEKVLQAGMAQDRDGVQRSRGKRRLSDFWHG